MNNADDGVDSVTTLIAIYNSEQVCNRIQHYTHGQLPQYLFAYHASICLLTTLVFVARTLPKDTCSTSQRSLAATQGGLLLILLDY